MKKFTLLALLMPLLAGAVTAAIYKWVDESGKTHYGDSPPPKSGSRSIPVPEGPSQEAVEQARQQMREKIEHYEKTFEQTSPPEPQDKSSQEAENRVVIPDNVACFTPLSDLVIGPAADTFTPITPSTLTKAQRRLLENLFGEADARILWRGTISDLQCMDSPSEPKSKITNFEVRKAIFDWDEHHARFTMEAETIGKESGVTERLFRLFEVGDALYFIASTSDRTINLDANKVELLKLSQNRILFLVKPRVRTRVGTIVRGEVRYLEISGRTIKLTELYYHNAALSGSKTWVLTK